MSRGQAVADRARGGLDEFLSHTESFSSSATCAHDALPLVDSFDHPQASR
jgi:hypothetical protein